METLRTRWRGAVLGGVAAAFLGCGGGTDLPPGTDGGMQLPDAGAALQDAGASGLDDGGSLPAGDAGTPGQDAGTPPAADAGIEDGGLSLLPVAAGADGCASAPLLAAGSWKVDTTGAAGDVSQWEGTCGVASTASGPDRFFTVEVPAGNLLRASLLAGSFSGARLVLLQDCAAPTSSCERLGSAQVAWANTSASPQQRVLAVDGFLSAQQGVAGLELELEPLAQQPAGATCAGAVTLGLPAHANGSTTGRDNLVDGYVGAGGVCNRYGNFPGAGGGGDVTYALEVPAGKTLSVSATGSGGWDLVVAILEGCGPASETCAAWSDPGTAQVTNTSGVQRTYFVVVDGFHPYSSGAYTLSASVN